MKIINKIYDLEISKKITLFYSILILSALLILTFFISTVYNQALRDNLIEELEAISEVVAINSVVALDFDDKVEGQKLISSFAVNQEIEYAIILNNNGQEFVHFDRSKNGYQNRTLFLKDTIWYSKNQVFLNKTINYKNVKHGSIFMVSSLNSLKEQKKQMLLISLFSILLVLIISILGGTKLAQTITTPIIELVKKMTFISETSDYTQQVKKMGNNEMGTLANSFNLMLNQIRVRDEKIRKNAENLEIQVENRTRQIREKNNELRNEIAIREKTEKSLEVSESKYRNIIENSTGMYYSHTPDHILTYVSAQCYNILGYTQNEMLINWTQITSDHPINKTGLDHTQRAIKTGKRSDPFELQLIHKKGHKIWVEVREGPITLNGKTTAIVGVLNDITQRKWIDEQLKEATQKALESERLKTSFLANMSHEIRTPMNAILGFSSLLEEDETSLSERKQYINIINERGNDLLTIINDILDISKVEAGLMKINKDKVDITAQMDDLLLFFSTNPKIINNSIKLQLFKASNDSFFIQTDGTRLRQILVNLLSNALKFTTKGSVEFGYEIKTVQGKQMIQFCVKDTGKGLSQKDMSIIFDRFRQADDGKKDYPGGTGLGLSISKALVNLMGGKIWVESIEYKGTTFFFTLPI